jgi:hypothetical protein
MAKIVKRVHAGRGQQTKWEIPVKTNVIFYGLYFYRYKNKLMLRVLACGDNDKSKAI